MRFGYFKIIFKQLSVKQCSGKMKDIFSSSWRIIHNHDLGVLETNKQKFQFEPKLKQDLFRFCFGLFHETKNKYI
jgi:hypothetical protein